MAAYHRVDDLCGLTACTSGSALGPTLGNEYGKHLPLPFKAHLVSHSVLCNTDGWVAGKTSEP